MEAGEGLGATDRTRSRTRRSAILRLSVFVGCIVATGLADAPRVAHAASGKAASVRQFSPQGEVATVRQARATFSEPMVAFGDPKLAAPFDVQCAAPGSGRWVDDRTWVFDFKNDVGPGTRCTFVLRAGTKTKDGTAVGGKASFAFSTGGPAIVRNYPQAGDNTQGIDEEQVFVLVLNGPATDASVKDNAWCAISGIAERVPVRIVGGRDRDELLKRFALTNRAESVTMLACTRRLPNSAKVALTWGRGIASPTGIATTVERALHFTVRDDFTASFTCERENAQAACVPVRPVRVEFTSPIARAVAERFVLRYADGGKTIERRPAFDADVRSSSVSSIEFRPPFAEKAELVIEAPKDLVDDAGRPLSNASLFPLKTKTALAPPLAKFAASPFGILELNAEPVLPLTVRHVEANLDVKGINVAPAVNKRADSRGLVRSVNVDAGATDATIVEWLRRVKRYHETSIPKSQVAREDLPAGVRETFDRERAGPGKRPVVPEGNIVHQNPEVETRELSLLKRDPQAKAIALPDAAKSEDPRPFEVIGIPLPEPGLHVVEVESQRLGAALLGRAAPMYVRTTALVTNLGVHVKLGRVNAGVWVTSLDRAQPITGAEVQISDCRGKSLWSGITDARGFAFVPRAFPEPDYADCGGDGGEPAYFVSARRTIGSGPNTGKVDMAFVWSNANQGIESWRFNLPMSERAYGDDAPNLPRLVAHTVFDRTLVRAGETVSMKHFIRREDLAALSLPDPKSLPTQAVVTHVGSDQEYPFDLAWREGRYAETVFKLPDDAKLGVYRVTLKNGERALDSGRFRVEAFRLPVMRGRIEVRGVDDKARRDFVRPASLTASVAIAYTNGGSAADLPVRVSAALRPHVDAFTGYEGFNFQRMERDEGEDVGFDDFVEDGPRADRGAPGQRVVADKLAVALDKGGSGRVELKDLPAIDGARELLVEATYPDPNGELQTIAQTVTLRTGGLVVGIKADDWVSVRNKTTVRMVSVNAQGKSIAGASIELRGVAKSIRSIRRRLVGGFYAYDNQRDTKELGLLCSGKSNAQGMLLCDVSLAEAGNVELVAKIKDVSGNEAESSTSVWVTRAGDVWFGGENMDRIDVLPEKRAYAPGEVAKFQVRMPFRTATALVTIERDGILATQVANIRGDDPTVMVKIQPDWSPNVFVSVLVVRGRIRDVPWYSFFTWGWKAPVDWWRAFRDEGRAYEAPTAMVDLGKPAFKYGIAAIRVDPDAHRLKVAVTTDRPDYATRAVAKATVKVTGPDGKPLPAGSEVALAAVDEALLELMPNDSWNLFEAMLRERGYGVETATATMQIIGKRHFGRKAAPPGGGGGVSPSRELFDTLLAWNPRVVLDANGAATVDVPLNDSLTAFRIVVVADAATNAGLFGTGSATIRTRQDLQIVAGLPPLVREGDRYQAGVTLRNTTKQAMDVEVDATVTPSTSFDAKSELGTPTKLAAQRVRVEPDASQRVEWTVTVPDDARSLAWRIDAKAANGRDSMTVAQRVVPAVPVTVQQATLAQVDRAFTIPVAAPTDAIRDAKGVARGGVSLALKPKLADGLPGVVAWFREYPYACLEQKSSIALGTLDEARWEQVVRQMPAYLDTDGLANYFPPRTDDVASGSDVLTAYLLSASAEATRLGRFAIPDATKSRMQAGLIAFVEGRIKREQWAPFSTDGERQLAVRKLAAIEALSREGKAQPRMLQSIQVLPNQWPTSAVLDWMAILKRVSAIPNRDARLAEADQIVRARLNYQGTRLDFSTEKDDFWYWLMASGDGNAARLLLTVVDDPAWKDDAPRLVVGALQRQRGGHWLTTTANVWGTLAVNAFSRQFERDAVDGRTRAVLGTAKETVAWSEQAAGATLQLPWPTKADAMLNVTHEGAGKPWLTVRSLAAVPLKAPFSSGYAIKRTLVPVEQKEKSSCSRGDVVRVRLEIDAQTDMTWVVVSDPVPAGATILGSGLGRDSQLAVAGEERKGWAWPAFEERGFDAYRAYYRFVPKGKFTIEYTVRLNGTGAFRLPNTRVEAMYAPEMFGEVPNALVEVKP